MRLIVVLAVFCPLLGGCLGNPAATGDDLAPALPGVPTVAVEDCLSTRVPFTVPAAQVEEMLPSPLEPQGPAPLLAVVDVEAQRCARARGLAHVAEDVWILWATVALRPPEGPAPDVSASRFVLLAAASDPTFANNLRTLGVPTQHLSVESVRPAGDLFEQWSMRAGTTTVRATLWSREATWSPDAPLNLVHEFAGRGPVSRTEVVDVRYPHNPLRDAGTLEVGGEGELVSALGGSATHAGPLGLHGLRRTWEPGA